MPFYNQIFGLLKPFLRSFCLSQGFGHVVGFFPALFWLQLPFWRVVCLAQGYVVYDALFLLARGLQRYFFASMWSTTLVLLHHHIGYWLFWWYLIFSTTKSYLWLCWKSQCVWHCAPVCVALHTKITHQDEQNHPFWVLHTLMTNPFPVTFSLFRSENPDDAQKQPAPQSLILHYLALSYLILPYLADFLSYYPS